mmetsp:Transcript_8770/g.20082  ORF Transcript_8770/g.20082 Transcript_8770/m.20082 type:complete len:978 (+) Transcript_8770:52-2985(+)
MKAVSGLIHRIKGDTLPTTDYGGLKQGKKEKTEGLGTMSGVFVPTMNSILGVVVFLRFGWAVGNAGVGMVLLMMGIGCTIAMITTLSVSAISTNQIVRQGGPYFMMSRSIGIETGGALAILFFASQTLGVGFYTMGFSEALGAYMRKNGDFPLSTLQLSLITISAVVLLSLCGSKIFAKISMAILAVIAVSIVVGILCFYIRDADPEYDFRQPSSTTLAENFGPEFKGNWNFLSVLSVIYPAMTAILTGATLSASLANPTVSIPLGTAMSVAAMCGLFSTIIITTGASVGRKQLQDNYYIIQDVSISPVLVLCGTLFATFSSALSGIMASARVLQAMARDHLLPGLHFFAVETGGEPRRAICLVFVLAVPPLFLGAVNAIGPLLTNFVLITFSGLNMTNALLHLSHTPNFRPGFKHSNWQISLLGWAMCLVLMFLLEPTTAALTCAAAILIAIFLYVKPPPIQDWGSITQALLYRSVLSYLTALDVRKKHVKYWRPQVLLMESRVTEKTGELQAARELTKRGLLVVGHVVQADLLDKTGTESTQDIVEELERIRDEALGNIVDKQKVRALVDVTVAPSLSAGCQSLMLVAGMGQMKPNTVFFGVPGHVAGMPTQVEIVEWLRALHSVQALGRNLVLGHALGDFNKRALHAAAKQNLRSSGNPNGRVSINVWVTAMELENLRLMASPRLTAGAVPVGPSRGGGDPTMRTSVARIMVMVQLAHVFMSNRFWRTMCDLRVLVLAEVENEVARAEIKRTVEKFMKRCHITARIEIVSIADLGDIIEEHKARTSVHRPGSTRFDGVDVQAADSAAVLPPWWPGSGSGASTPIAVETVAGVAGAHMSPHTGPLSLHRGASIEMADVTIQPVPETAEMEVFPVARPSADKPKIDAEVIDNPRLLAERTYQALPISQKCVMLNKLILLHSIGACVHIVQIPIEPASVGLNSEEAHKFLGDMGLLTHSVGPTLLVAPGVQQVAVLD